MATAVSTLPGAAAERARPRAVACWLFAVAAIVVAMIVIGGITRLTESGLSIVRWDPVGGVVPPLSAADWAREYAAYRTSPQGILVNADMGLAAFKHIFFWEYLHRVVARIFVAVLVIGLTGFAAMRAVPAGYGRRLGLLLALGALEPIVGWWMVASGLVDRPSVAPERLAFHLLTALAILSVALWTALDLLPSRLREGSGVGMPRLSDSPPPAPPATGRGGRWILPFAALLITQLTWGALTAGLRAGHAADTWPLMGDRLIPALGSLTGDPVSVQFVHRSLAWAVAAAALTVAALTGRAGAGRRAVTLAALVILQFALGVLTVVLDVPVAVAAAHQACAALLVAATVWLAHWSLR